MFARGHAFKRTNSLFPSCEAALNNVAYSSPLASLLETARVTAHNKRPHLTASVCWSVTTTQMAKCVFSWYARTDGIQRVVVFGPPPSDLPCGVWSNLHLQTGLLCTTSAVQRQRLFNSSIPLRAQARMGCSTSTQTSAVDTSRPSAKPEEINGATVTGDHQNLPLS